MCCTMGTACSFIMVAANRMIAQWDEPCGASLDTLMDFPTVSQRARLHVWLLQKILFYIWLTYVV